MFNIIESDHVYKMKRPEVRNKFRYLKKNMVYQQLHQRLKWWTILAGPDQVQRSQM
jgi:hypothetical protein